MSKFIDSLDFKPDNFSVAPRAQWSIIGLGIARKSKKLPRFCLPNCEFYRRDIDGGPLCYDECNKFVFDTHVVNRDDSIINLVFGTMADDPHTGVSWWVGEKYLRELLGDKKVDKMLKKFHSMVEPPDGGIPIGTQED